MKHLFTTLLLALCAALTAAAQTATIGGLLFEVTSPTTCKVSQDEDPSPSGDVTIPSQVSIDGKNYTVTAIDFGAFWACKTLTSISIPAAVTTIDEKAFIYCEALLRIDVHEANKHFCSVDGVLFDKEKTTFIAYPAGKANTTYEIPASVTTIGSGAFDGCKVLTSISIPNSVTTIGYGAFEDCDALTGIEIPASVTTIKNGAFRYCNALTGIEIPASVTSINGDAFYGCTALSHINVHEANKHFCSVDGVLFNKDKSSIIAYPAGKTNKTYEIPASVTDIGTSAFSYCEALTNITIPSCVTSIGSSAFVGCKSLTRISIPKSVTYIGIKALEDSENITSICCYAKKPPVIDMHDFFPYDATIHVPKGCKKAYLRAEYWQDCTIVDDL